MVAIVILDLEVLAQHLDLVMVGYDDHISLQRDLAKHPNVQILSEISQDQHLHFPPLHQVKQHLDCCFKQCGIQC